ncbi:MAG: glycosyltransferase family 4 protein [Candidatus Marinimicrobia bacterium]|nr:glycosyltransferase family 4 protein [Candidatus Neomarinimicrobiota bacterium]
MPLKLVYAGSLSTARGITDLVEAVSQVWSESGRVTLDIFGQMGEMELAHWLRSPEFSGWLHYHGWVPVTELSRCLPEFHVGINPVRDYPNYRYSLLTKIFDYVAAGLPVITTDLPGIMGEFGEDGFLASYSSGDIAGLASAIRAFFDEDRRATMAKKALEVSRRYSWDSQAQVLLEIYREILA